MKHARFAICPDCHRCDCGAGPFDDAAAETHIAMHAGAVPTVVQPSTTLPDPSVAAATLSVMLESWSAGTGTWEDLANILCDYIEQLHELIRWAAIAYQGNEPVWLTENMYGHPLPENNRLIETWRGVIG